MTCKSINLTHVKTNKSAHCLLGDSSQFAALAQISSCQLERSQRCSIAIRTTGSPIHQPNRSRTISRVFDTSNLFGFLVRR